MIVCHCNLIDHRDIERAADALAATDPWHLLTPVAVYDAIGFRPRCGGCLPLAANIIHTRQLAEADRCARCPLADVSHAIDGHGAAQGSPPPAVLDAAE